MDWEDYHLPKSKSERLELGEQVGQDGLQLLETILEKESPAWIREIPAVEILRQVWVQNFYEDENGLHWRGSGNIPPGCKNDLLPFLTWKPATIPSGITIGSVTKCISQRFVHRKTLI